MKKLLTLFALFLPLFLFAQAASSSSAAAVVVTTPPTDADWLALFGALGGMKGAAIIVFAVQALMLLARGPLSALEGKYRLLVVIALSVVAGVLQLHIMGGLGWIAAMMSGSTLASVQVLIHQLYSQFIQADPPTVITGK